MKRYCPHCGLAIHAHEADCTRCSDETRSIAEQLSELLGFRVHVEHVNATRIA